MYFTGIGSRQITESDKYKIKYICNILNEYEYICLSGNASGADIEWQTHIDNYLVVLPWLHFNFDNFIPDENKCILPEPNKKAIESLKLHPNYKKLNDATKNLMIRNYYQIFPMKNTRSSFVLYCADEDDRGVSGGTGQAVRLAIKNNIPTFNVRTNTLDDFDIWFKENQMV